MLQLPDATASLVLLSACLSEDLPADPSDCSARLRRISRVVAPFGPNVVPLRRSLSTGVAVDGAVATLFGFCASCTKRGGCGGKLV